MKNVLLAVGLLFLVGVSALAWIVFRGAGEPVAKPLTEYPEILSGLRLVPDDAKNVVLIPNARSVRRAAARNPITSNLIQEWEDRWRAHSLRYFPGDPEILGWTEDGVSCLAIGTGPLQRTLIRFASRFDAKGRRFSTEGEWLLTCPPGTSPMTAAVVSETVEVSGMQRGSLFLLTEGERLNPGRPERARAVVAARFDGNHLRLAARSRRRESAALPIAARSIGFPPGALVSVRIRQAPSGIRELERFTGAGLSRLLDGGGMLSLYKLEDRKLLPRLQGVLVVPADAAKAGELAEVVERLTPSVDSAVARFLGGRRRKSQRSGPDEVSVTRLETLGYTVEHAFSGGQFMVGFDKSSLDKYLRDRREPDRAEDNFEWVVHADSEQLARLRRMGESDSVRIFAPDLSRRIGELSRVTSSLPEGVRIDASSANSGLYDETSVTFTAK